MTFEISNVSRDGAKVRQTMSARLGTSMDWKLGEWKKTRWCVISSLRDTYNQIKEQGRKKKINKFSLKLVAL